MRGRGSGRLVLGGGGSGLASREQAAGVQLDAEQVEGHTGTGGETWAEAGGKGAGGMVFCPLLLLSLPQHWGGGRRG